MKHTTCFDIAIPIDRIRSAGPCGAKAVTVAKLYRAGFLVPEGFCISADAYRTHLWYSGVRDLARRGPDAAGRETIRRAIMDSDLPKDVLAAITAAYKDLGPSAVVAVRHSALDEDAAGTAYSSVVGVTGRAALVEAVKSVWASLWSDEAAALRDKTSRRREPRMAVLVEVAVDALASGVAVTANPTTGEPSEVHIRSGLGICGTDGLTDRFVVSLDDFSVTGTSIARKESFQRIGKSGLENHSVPADRMEAPSLTPAQAVEVAEAAIWVEHNLGGRQLVQWAHDGEKVVILGAWPAELETYFPAAFLGQKDENATWRLGPREPISPLAQSMSVFQETRLVSLPSARKRAGLRCENGRVYERVVGSGEVGGRFSALLDTVAGAGLHREWKLASGRIAKESRRDLSRPVSTLPLPRLLAHTKKALDRADLSAQWYEVASYPLLRFPQLLRELLASVGTKSALVGDLLQGCDGIRLRNDVEMQRLSAYVWQDATSETPGDSAEEIAEQLAGRLGYVFRGPKDAWDPAAWRSWLEDPSPIMDVARTLAKGPEIDVELAAKEARANASAAEKMVYGAIVTSRRWLKRPFTRLKFRILLRRARGWTASRSERGQVHALALSALRVYLAELGRRLSDAGVLMDPNDVFYFRAEEIAGLTVNATKSSLNGLPYVLAERKHSFWLQSRLAPPKWLPSGSGPHYTPDTRHGTRRELEGTPNGSGETTGLARVAHSKEELGKLKPGEILVVEELSPAWTPALSLAVGLLMERGDLLSPGAVTARDYGIPCVTIPGATSVICTGSLLSVDGSSGRVTILRRR